MFLGPGQPPTSFYLQFSCQWAFWKLPIFPGFPFSATRQSTVRSDRGRLKFGGQPQRPPFHHFVLKGQLPVERHGSVWITSVQFDIQFILSVFWTECFWPEMFEYELWVYVRIRILFRNYVRMFLFQNRQVCNERLGKWRWFCTEHFFVKI